MAINDETQVRAATDEDTPRIVRAGLGPEDYFTDRLGLQHRGVGDLLIALRREEVIGCIYISYEEADEPQLRELLPGVPVFHRLLVVETHRNAGVGTALVRAAERTARDRGHRQLALGLNLDNDTAERLYLRLGYREWPHGLLDTYYIATLDGQQVQVPEQCKIFMTNLDG